MRPKIDLAAAMLKAVSRYNEGIRRVEISAQDITHLRSRSLNVQDVRFGIFVHLSRLRSWKKLSATSLSWQLPRRLMLLSRLWSRREPCQSWHLN